MSRFLKTMIALLVVAGLAVPAVSMAEDRLSLSGYYTLRGYSKDNLNYNDDVSDSSQYFYQRFRLGGKLAVADGVSIKFRADIAEGTTAAAQPDNDGDDFAEGGGGASSAGNIQFDKVYAEFDKDAYTLAAGQFGGGFGNAMMLDMTRTTAIKLTLKSINLTLEYHKLVEGSATEFDDIDLYMVVWGMANDTFNLDLMGGYVNMGGNSDPAYPVYDDGNLMMAGANAVFNLGGAKINTELDYLDGEYNTAAASTDAKGLQFYVDAGFSLTETVTLGGAAVYAKAYNGAGEVQVTGVGYDFEPEEYGYMKTIMGGAYAGNALDPAGANAGVLSGQFYAGFQLNDSIGFKGSLTYAQPDDDGATVDYDSFLVAGASVRYKFAANTTIDAQYIYSQPDAKTGIADDAKMLAGCRLTVSF